jgi:glucosamine--fructose-6-phosphate aminotransferase (isomerizing)
LPLQLFTYYLALAKGTNPDGFRLEDPRFAEASRQVQL